MIIWYKKTPLGKNDIRNILSKAAKKANLQQGKGAKMSNHFVRKTSISRLLVADIPESYAAQLSGHKSIDSLQSYESASQQHQQKMSLTLSRSQQSQSDDSSSSSIPTSCNWSDPSVQPVFPSSEKTTTNVLGSSFLSTAENSFSSTLNVAPTSVMLANGHGGSTICRIKCS